MAVNDTGFEEYPWVAGFDAAFDADFWLDRDVRSPFTRSTIPLEHVIRQNIGIYACNSETEWRDMDKYDGRVTICVYSLDYICKEYGIDPLESDAFRFMQGANDYLKTAAEEEVYV